MYRIRTYCNANKQSKVINLVYATLDLWRSKWAMIIGHLWPFISMLFIPLSLLSLFFYFLFCYLVLIVFISLCLQLDINSWHQSQSRKREPKSWCGDWEWSLQTCSLQLKSKVSVLSPPWSSLSYSHLFSFSPSSHSKPCDLYPSKSSPSKATPAQRKEEAFNE